MATISQAFAKLQASIAGGNVPEIKQLAEELSGLIASYVELRKNDLHPNIQAFFENIQGGLQGLFKAGSQKHIEAIWNQVLKDYDNITYYGVTYVLSTDDVKKHSSLTHEEREKAKQFSSYLIADILASPKPVKICLYASSYQNTKAFIELIQEHLISAAEHFEKQIHFVHGNGEKIDGGLLDWGSSGNLEEWASSDNGREAFNYLFNFFTNCQYNDTEFFRINIGVTHLAMLLGFLINHFQIEPKINQDRPFVKYQFGDFFYQEWR